MRKAVLLLLAALSLTACRLHDKYTGEPFIHLEYTVGGERFVYEDWGVMWSSYYFGAESGGAGLQHKQIDANTTQARFGLETDYLTLWLPCDKPYYTDGKVYEYKYDPQSRRPYTCILDVPQTGRLTKGHYSLTRKCSKPYCTYEVHFEFTCKGGQGDFEVTDGVIQVGRRFQEKDISNFIKSE
ncbi:MAG: hypothetical protein IKZ91_03530 [Bacteroidales bacterium]|nr:hypothetical protein [Bacteroidales bacterium]